MGYNFEQDEAQNIVEEPAVAPASSSRGSEVVAVANK